MNKAIFVIFMVLLIVCSCGQIWAEAKKSQSNASVVLQKQTKKKPSTTKKSPNKGEDSQRIHKKTATDPAIKSLTQGLDFLNPSKKKGQNRKTSTAVQRQGALSQLSPRSLLVLAQAYEQKGDYKNQVLTLRRLVQKNKKKELYLLELSKGLRKLYFKTGIFKHREEAIKTIQQVYALKKKYHERARLEMLELLKFSEDSEENKYAILKLLQDLIREFGVKKSYVRDMCKYLYINKFYRQSLSSCKKAIKYYPAEPENYVYYALSLEDETKKEKHLKHTGRRFPKSLFVQLKIGQFFIEQKDYLSALPHFKNAVQWGGSDSAPAQLGLAQSLFHTEREKQSYKLFLKACMLDKPKMLWFFKQAKSILNQKGRFALASGFDKGITKCVLKAKYPQKKF